MRKPNSPPKRDMGKKSPAKHRVGLLGALDPMGSWRLMLRARDKPVEKIHPKKPYSVNSRVHARIGDHQRKVRGLARKAA